MTKLSFLYLQNAETVTILTNSTNSNLKKYDTMHELLFDAEKVTSTDIAYYSMKLTASDGNYTQTSELKNFTGEELDQLINSFTNDMNSFGLSVSKIELV
jgi:hypothetical protein